MAVNLEDAWAKLRWARYHFETLRPEIEAFEKRDTHTFSVDFNADAGKYTFYVHGLDTPDPDWGLQIGDCLHNARTALDYVMVRLVALIRGQEPRHVERVQFPVFSQPEDPRFSSDLKKELLLSGYLTRVEELQPFNNGNPSIWGYRNWGQTSVFPLGGPPNLSPLPSALERLSTLDIVDKHRVINAVWLGGAFQKVATFPDIPSDFRAKGSTHGFGPLEDGAEVGSLTFETPLPHQWQPDQVDMQSHFRLQVSLDEPTPFSGVLEVLPICLWAVEAVLTIFEPVFAHGAPPLPVTAVGLPQQIS